METKLRIRKKEDGSAVKLSHDLFSCWKDMSFLNDTLFDTPIVHTQVNTAIPLPDGE